MSAAPTNARFGKYDLLAQLATGGMAEIWLARISGEAVCAPDCVGLELGEGAIGDWGRCGAWAMAGCTCAVCWPGCPDSAPVDKAQDLAGLLNDALGAGAGSARRATRSEIAPGRGDKIRINWLAYTAAPKAPGRSSSSSAPMRVSKTMPASATRRRSRLAFLRLSAVNVSR